MGVLVLGDVGAMVSYHVGDEAMTEYALAALAERGVDDVTVMAGNVKAAERRFGRNVVPRIGFDSSQDDAWRAKRLEAVVQSVDGRASRLDRDDPARAVVKAVEASTGVVVCGGGNIAAQFPNHLYERMALAAIARAVGRPLVFTSQTFGPMFRADQEEAVGAMLAGAELVGARERDSYDLALALGSHPERTAHTLDDGFWLEPTATELERVDALGLPDAFVLAGFTGHAGSTGWTREENQRHVADTLELLATELGLPVLLASHVGSLVEHRRHHDQLANDAIDALTSSAVSTLPMLTAGEVVAVTRRATLNVSSRYHPTVFGPAAGVPTLAFTQSLYSSVKIGGALRNVGLGDYAIPAASWRHDLVLEAARLQLSSAAGLQSHLAAVRETRRAESARWWDAVVGCVTGRGVASAPTSLADVPTLAGSPRWSDEVRVVAGVADAAERDATTAGWEVDRLRTRVKRLKAKLA